MRSRGLLPVLLALCLPSLGQAQLRVGASAELNRASFGGVPPEDAAYASNYGTGFAGILEYRVNKDLVLSLQPGWVQKGAKVVFNEEEKPDSVQTFVVEQSWLTVPLYFRIDSDGRGFYAGGGISVDFLLSSELEHEGSTADNSSLFEDIDGVYQFVAGYMFETGKRSLFLEARYMQGMTTISKANRASVGDLYVADFKSTGMRLVAGILF